MTLNIILDKETMRREKFYNKIYNKGLIHIYNEAVVNTIVCMNYQYDVASNLILNLAETHVAKCMNKYIKKQQTDVMK